MTGRVRRKEVTLCTGLCCQIIKGEIWNPAIYRCGTKGDMMQLRLMAAFDAGVRREKMMLI